MKPRYIGVVFDDYTPQVEGQLTRDVIALTQLAAKRNADEEIVIVCESDKPDRLLEALNVRRVPTLQLARTWLVYRTKEDWPEVPDFALTVIQRDMLVKVRRNTLRVNSEQESDGYYLPPQGRPRPDKISMMRPAPNGYSPVDPALIMLWS